MSNKKLNHQEMFDSINTDLLQYSGESQPLYDEILTVEERYSKGTVVNKGGMKKIARTTDAMTNRIVAKATLIDFEDPVKTENFLREARITASLEHPNIIPVYDVGVDDVEGPYFTMKLVGGKNLADVIQEISKNERKYSLRDLINIFLKICDAVEYAHSKGILHLDLKPENIQVDDYGEVLICDWGIAKIMEYSDDDILSGFETELDPAVYNDVTLHGYIKGTPGYMAPEQINPEFGVKDRRTDIFALGGVLYSLLTLKSPYKSEELKDILKETVEGNILLPSQRVEHGFVPASLDSVTMKALSVNPEARYSSVAELSNDITNWLEGYATEAEDASFLTSFLLLMKRHKLVSSLLFVILLSTVFSFYKISQNERRAVENEKLAQENEKKATKTLDLYLDEKKLTEQIGGHAINQLMAINEYHLRNMEFEKALDFINETIKYESESPILNALKGETLFYQQRYTEALKYLDKAGEFKKQLPQKLMLEIAPKYAELKAEHGLVPAESFLNLYQFFPKKYQNRIWEYELSKFSDLEKYQQFLEPLGKLAELKNHLETCRLFVIETEKFVTKDNLNFNYTLEKDGIVFDLSNSKRLQLGVKFSHLPVKSLNVENTTLWRNWVFDHYHLKSLNICNSGFVMLKKENFRGSVSVLDELTISKKQNENTDHLDWFKKKVKLIVK